MNNYTFFSHFILVYIILCQVFGQKNIQCPNFILSKGYTFWKDIQFEQLAIHWELPACMNSLNCLGIEVPYNFSNFFQQKPLHIQKETSVLFSSNASHAEFYKVMAVDDFAKCDFSNAIKIEGNNVSISNRYLAFGNNYFIAKSDEFYDICLFGFKLNITVHSYDCLDRNKTCNGKGICAALPWDNQFKCICCPAYISNYCEEVDGCYNIICRNGGICVDIPDKESPSNLFRCLCPTGFEGQMCETQVAEYCMVNTCMNGGTCFINSSSPLFYSCSCPTLFDGKVCEISKDFCSPNPCLNGGICISSSLYPYYLCKCLKGFIGLECGLDRRLCTEMNCKNGGTCNDFNNSSPICTCLPNYFGKDCSILNSACNSNPCFNTTQCVVDEFGYKCICQSGKECAIYINNCESSPCLSGKICIDNIAGYTCVEEIHNVTISTLSATLQFSEIINFTSTSNDKTISRISIIFIVIGCGLTFILLIVILICCFHRYSLKNLFKKHRIKYDKNLDNSFSNCKSDVKPDELFCEAIYPKLLHSKKKKVPTATLR